MLSNVELRVAIAEGRLLVKPAPKLSPGLPGTLYDEASLTVHVGDVVHMPRENLQVAFDLSLPGDIKATLDGALKEVPIPPSGWVLEPHDFVLANVREWIGFPLPKHGKKPLMGRIEGRSKFARLGLLVHATAPTLHPDWEGHITSRSS